MVPGAGFFGQATQKRVRRPAKSFGLQLTEQGRLHRGILTRLDSWNWWCECAIGAVLLRRCPSATRTVGQLCAAQSSCSCPVCRRSTGRKPPRRDATQTLLRGLQAWPCCRELAKNQSKRLLRDNLLLRRPSTSFSNKTPCSRKPRSWTWRDACTVAPKPTLSNSDARRPCCFPCCRTRPLKIRTEPRWQRRTSRESRSITTEIGANTWPAPSSLPCHN